MAEKHEVDCDLEAADTKAAAIYAVQNLKRVL